jgi:hypothetical protein
MPIIITASDLVVGGNIVVGGFLQQGTDLTATVVIPTSLTISGIEVSVIDNEGLRVDFSGAGLVGLSICGDPIISSTQFNTLSAEFIDISGQVNTLSADFLNLSTGFNTLSAEFIDISGQVNTLSATVVNYSTSFSTLQLAVGTTTLSGALNVSGDVYVSGSVYTASQSVYVGEAQISQNQTALEFTSTSITISGIAQPVFQHDNGILTGGTVTVVLDRAYDSTSFYQVSITPYGDNSGFYVTKDTPSQFIVTEANGGTGNWSFGWLTFGFIDGMYD